MQVIVQKIQLQIKQIKLRIVQLASLWPSMLMLAMLKPRHPDPGEAAQAHLQVSPGVQRRPADPVQEERHHRGQEKQAPPGPEERRGHRAG